MKLIDKAAVVAEIVKRRDLHYKYYMKNGVGSIAECKYDEDRDILSFLDTLEAKEVNLEKEIKDYFNNQPIITRNQCVNYQLIPSGREIAKHFYELGLRAKEE